MTRRLYIVTSKKLGAATHIFLANGQEIPNVLSISERVGPLQTASITIELNDYILVSAQVPPKRKRKTGGLRYEGLSENYRLLKTVAKAAAREPLVKARSVLTEALQELEFWIEECCARKFLKQHRALLARLRKEGGVDDSLPEAIQSREAK